MGMSRKAFKGFSGRWDEYEVVLTRILPRSVARNDPDLGEDLDHILYCRDRLEEDLAQHPDDPKLVPYRAQLATLDMILLSRRRDILAHYPLRYYRARRKRLQAPRAHWWWYLDELEEPAVFTPEIQSRRRPRKEREKEMAFASET